MGTLEATTSRHGKGWGGGTMWTLEREHVHIDNLVTSTKLNAIVRAVDSSEYLPNTLYVLGQLP
jgi:hypothetical protein